MSFLSLPVPRKPRNSGRRLLGWLAARPFHLATQSTPPRPSGRWAGGRGMARVPGASLAEVAVCPARALDARSGPSVPGARRRPALAPAPSRARGGSDSARRLTVVLGPRRPSRRAHRTGPGTPLGPAGSRVCSPRPPPPGAAAGRLRGARGRGRGPRRSQCSRGCGRLRLRLSQSVSPQQWRKEVSERSCSRRLLSLRPSACARGPARGLTTLAGRPGRPAAG